MIWNITKSLILYRLFTSPMLETAVICTSLLLCLFFGAFVKLKNGILSWICYFILLGIPITLLTINIANVNLPVEDLQLSDTKAEQYIEVNGNGIVFKRFLRRQVTEPLLGINPITDQQRIDDFVAYINRTYPDGIISYKTSKKYDGIMLIDKSGNDVNLLLIQDGFVSVSDKAPTQYLIAANNARSRSVGIYASKVGMRPSHIIKLSFYALCFILGWYTMSMYQLCYRTRALLNIKLTLPEKQNEKEKDSNRTKGNDKNGTGGGDSGSGT